MKRCAYLLISVAIFAQACSTCPPCVPTHEFQDVAIPVFSCPDPPDIPPVVLPPWPVLADDASDNETKQWYVDMVEVYKARTTILNQRIDSLTAIIEAYRDNED